MFWQNKKKFNFLTSVVRFSIFSDNGSYDSERLGRVEIVTLGVRAPHFLLSSVSTWRFREQKHLRARRKGLHCRLPQRAYSTLRNETKRNEMVLCETVLCETVTTQCFITPYLEYLEFH